MAVLWQDNDARSFLGTIVGHDDVPPHRAPKVSLAERRPKWTNSIVTFCLALRDGNSQLAAQIRRQYASSARAEDVGFDDCLLTCSLLFGAEHDLSLVRYIMESENVGKNEVLTSTKWMKAQFTDYPMIMSAEIKRNALSFAIGKGKEDVVEYLLEGWRSPCQTIWGDQVYSIPPFDSHQYFSKILLEPIAGFATLNFDLQSTWYFCKRYLGSNFPGEDEDWLAIARKRLESDEAFLMSRVRLQDEGSLFNILWELYGHDQQLFLAMMNDKEAISLHYFLPLHHSTLTPAKKPLLESLRMKRSFRLRMLGEALLIIQNDWDQFEEHWRQAGGFDYLQTAEFEAGLYDHPFMHGLKFLVRDMYKTALNEEAMNAVTFVSNHAPKSPNLLDPADDLEQQRNDIYFLIAAAGSGKTHRMFNMLENRFGFYLVSGGVSSQAPLVSVPGETLYLPSRTRTSGDTELLFRTVKNGGLRRRGSWGVDSAAELVQMNRVPFLMVSRLNLFFSVQRECASLQPWQWLRYQIAYNGLDPFQRLFHHLVLLGDTTFLEWSDVGKDTPLLWCFDEVQCDTARVNILNQRSPMDNVARRLTILESLIKWFATLKGWNCGILGGTAMNFGLIQTQVNYGILEANPDLGTDSSWSEPGLILLNPCSLVTNDAALEGVLRPSVRSAIDVIWEPSSPTGRIVDLDDSMRKNLRSSLVGDETIFKDSFISRVVQRRQQGLWNGLQKTQAADEVSSYLLLPKIWGWISAYGAALRGRYRWSVSFIEKLFEVYLCNQALDERLISQASDDVQKRVRAPLIQRIEKLATGDLENRKLANDVFQMAMQAMLFGRSRILETAQAETLIEQAIGSVQGKEPGNLNVRLTEWLVVEAVMEYLQRKGESLIDATLGSWQYRPSSFGFIAEDRLAEAIYGNTAAEQEMTIRKSFLRKLDSVNKISTQGIGVQSSLNLEEFVLEIIRGQGPPPSDEVGNVVLWLNHVLSGTPRPVFLLPSESAGPDVMFVLRKQDNTQVKRLICAVQSKVVKKINIDQGVQNTLDPDQWYCGSSKLNERAEFLDALHNFKNESANRRNEKIEFLSILLLARQKSVNTQKILLSLAGRKSPGFAQEIKWSAQDRLEKLNSSLQNPKIKTKPTAQELHEANNNVLYANEVENGISSTEYHVKVVTFESVEDIFGPIFFRLLKGTQEDS